MQKEIIGSVIITGATGAIVAGSNTGFVSACVRNGLGDYSFTLQRAITLADVDVGVTQIHAGTRGGHAVELVDATHVRVRTVDAANPNAAADPTQLKVTFKKTRW